MLRVRVTARDLLEIELYTDRNLDEEKEVGQCPGHRSPPNEALVPDTVSQTPRKEQSTAPVDGVSKGPQIEARRASQERMARYCDRYTARWRDCSNCRQNA